MRLAQQNALTVAIALLGMTAAFGQTTSTPLSGYECRMLNITEQQSMDPTFHVVVRSGPCENAGGSGKRISSDAASEQSDGLDFSR
jgi:hypothetical protein